jgi:hypothetical protein
MSSLRTVILESCPAEGFAGLAASLLRQEVGAPTLLVARFAEDALLLGRHQRAASAVDLDGAAARGLVVARRAGGGKALRAAPGTIGVLLAVPPGGWPQPLAPDKVLNRCVRGLLRGLTAGGATGGAAYFGRDFVAWRQQQIAVVSQDGAPGGTRLFEAVVAASAPLALPAGLSLAPPHDDPRALGPPHAVLPGADFARVAGALVDAWAEALGATAAPEDAVPPAASPPAPPIVEDETDFARGGPLQVPIGFVEAWVRRDGERIAAARVRGDFIAPAFAREELEATLVGRRLRFEEVGPIVDAAFGRRDATIIGLRGLTPLAEALLGRA